jgi:ABC-type branched-subunit amino acid transport system ATPase component
MNVASRRFLHNRLILCASARQSSLAAQATAAQAILFRVLDIADRAYVLDQGGVVYHGAAHELPADNDIKERYCSV